MYRAAGIALAFTIATPAAAQDNAVSSAIDAFGERVGIEQLGLYSETQVRGFDLNDSGGYRIDDAYFSRASPLDDTVLAGVGVRVGVNATRLAYPAPSGVVNYRLREAGALNEVRLSAGYRDFGTQVIGGDGSFRAGAFGLSGGFLWRPEAHYAQGYQGAGINVGAVGSWDLGPTQRLRVFGSLYQRHYDGDYAVIATGAAMPPSLLRLHQYSPDWARTQASSTNFGVLYNRRFDAFTLDVSAFRSVFDIENNDYTLISSDVAGNATAVTYRSPGRTMLSDSVEARLGRQFEAGGLGHLVTLSLRGRRTATDLVSSLAVPLGAFNLPNDDPPTVAEPIWTGTRGADEVEQLTASAGYGLAWRDRAQIRFAIHRTRYDKAVTSIANVESERTSESTHYSASAIIKLSDHATMFASWVTGLEESGTAPTTATNRDEVLAPVEASQYELGVRYALSPRLTLIGALFDVSKPSQGFRMDGSYGIVGEVRHAGFEASVAGELDEETNLVFGIVSFQSLLSGPLVDARIVGAHDAGVSPLVANATFERRFGSAWSLDATVSYTGERWGDTANTFQAPAYTTLSLGMRHRFNVAGRQAELRVLASNLTGAEGYVAAPSGLLSPIAPRTLRAILTLALGPNQ